VIESRERRGRALGTPRLVLRRLTERDAAFLLELVNDPDFVRNIGDRGVRTLADARAYLRRGALASYRRHGFGHYLVTLRESRAAIGICGLARREPLDAPDLGFAFLPEHRGRGYAAEASAAVLEEAREVHGLARVLAVALPENRPSIRVREKLARFTDPWQPKIVGELNGQHVKVAKFQGPFVWHRHEAEDELFLVLQGSFEMELRDRTVTVREGEFLIVPRGVEHRPVAAEEVHVLLFEPAGTLNTGDAGGPRTVARPERI
jgi:RimJ/RimL family protein N-acetyltransferase